MKHILYIILLIFSSSVFAQSSIVTDELYLKYEKAYTNYHNSRDFQEYQKLDKMDGDFYKSFNNAKALNSYRKSKDPLKWLQKNLSKTTFSNIDEAHKLYNDILAIRQKLESEAMVHIELFNQLLKKYDSEIIWNTLKARLPK